MEDRGTVVDPKVALLALLHHSEPRVKWDDIRQSMVDGSSPEQILDGPDLALFGSDVSESIAAASRDLNAWESQGIRVLTPLDEDYPAQLKSVYDFPLVLFARGHVIHDHHSAAIVGSREFSLGGQRFAAELAQLLAESGITVVSGLAKGIDGTAHKAALRAGGRTVAVIGNGLDVTYPTENRALQAEIQKRGLLISQFQPTTRPTRASFPQRNVTMSAYSAVTVIAEAREASGTRIQARAAIKHARPLVLTQQVAETTTWGREFSSGGYDVTVVGSAAEGCVAVQRILARSEQASLAFA